LKRKLLTDVELRANWSLCRGDTYTVEEGTCLTPAARDFLREQGIALRYETGGRTAMTTTPVPVRGGKRVYVDAATGARMEEKPEELTHLRGNLLVPKTHPRICLRGMLDSLMAQIIEVQVLAAGGGEERLAEDLEELLAFVRRIMAAEVKEEPLEELFLLGMGSAAIRRASHQVRETFGIDHPVPHYRMGAVCVALNLLRTRVRETELAAARAFETESGFSRRDLIQGLNRLSSCVYILLCRRLSGYYNGGKNL